jgi:hypothetical protein
MLANVKSARSANRAKAWHADRTRAAAYWLGKARDDEERALVEHAYEEEMARGPDFLHHRGRSVFQEAARAGFDRNTFARILKALEALERGVYRTGRRKGAHGVSRCVGRVLKALLGLALRYQGEVRPSLVGLARLANVGKQAVVDAIKFLERYGFIDKQRRIKRIRTPFGPKVVQDTNFYTVHEPRGLGAIASEMWGFRSESATEAPSPNDFDSLPLRAACGGERTPSSTAREAFGREGWRISLPDGVFLRP